MIDSTTFNPSDYTEHLGAKEPRYYQIDAVRKTAEYLEEGFRRIEVKGPTGCGKTMTSKMVTMSKRVREAIGFTEDRPMRVLFVSHRHRLNRQAAQEFAGAQSIELIPQSAFSAIPESVIERGWDLCLIDECHHEAMTSIQLMLSDLIRAPIIGFTADSQRNDGKMTKFDRCVVMISEAEAASRGFIEKAGINTILDYSGANKAQLAIELVKEYGGSMGNTIAFFNTTSEVREFHAGLLEMGYTSGYLDEHSNETDLDNLLDQLSEGSIQFLSNCTRVGEGIDTPNVTDVLLMRPFNSRAEKRQYIGRAIRADSPCAAWELINPLERCIASEDCVGGIKYKRLIYKHKGVWTQKVTEGEDLTWGQMSKLRAMPDDQRAKIETPEDDDFDYQYESGGALDTLKSLGIDTNTNVAVSDEDSRQKLSQWIAEHMTQMPLFDHTPAANFDAEITVTKRRRSRAA